ncbi:hypothetical protein Cgig2_012022 [Carnegiea gigantea]|uniref:Uncharacterized protein n=1 Tax=Carnegiea gigantea TaxID=171969 RepID=A0A9Q1KSJ9_9CARY|nr:hypothetical protein Cgig2_012022 [Carnegiea gigantea]
MLQPRNIQFTAGMEVVANTERAALLGNIIGQPAEAAGPHNLNFESSGNIFMVVVNKVEDSSVNSLCHHSVDFDGLPPWDLYRVIDYCSKGVGGSEPLALLCQKARKRRSLTPSRKQVDKDLTALPNLTVQNWTSMTVTDSVTMTMVGSEQVDRKQKKNDLSTHLEQEEGNGLLPRITVTVKHPGRHSNKLSALSRKLGGPVLINTCRTGMASDAAIACDFAIPTGMFDHECLSKHRISNTDSWASPLPDLNAATKWGIHAVVASDI